MNEASDSSSSSRSSSSNDPPFWCDVCSLDLRSSSSLQEHQKGRKHLNRQFQSGGTNQQRPPSSALPPIDEEELFANIAAGTYTSIVVLTGAGISTSAGLPDYRSSGNGWFDTMLREYSARFPEVDGDPETLFSRDFANKHPDVWENELLPRKQAYFQGLQPTLAHRFCAYLYHRGWLRRIYTQNVDGLHTHSTLGIPSEAVVECHGSIMDQSLVMYGDPLPDRFARQVKADFDENTKHPVDLVIVMGTSLQVAPFCGLPNLAPRGCTRVLVNRFLDHCLQNQFSKRGSPESSSCYGLPCTRTTRIGSRKHVTLQPLWTGSRGRKKWRQLLVESDCDDFVQRFCQHCGDGDLVLKCTKREAQPSAGA